MKKLKTKMTWVYRVFEGMAIILTKYGHESIVLFLENGLFFDKIQA